MARQFCDLLELTSFDWESSCMNWNRHRMKDGYGRLSWNGKLYLAHRLAAFLYGDITREQLEARDNVVMHECDNPACINPMHLRLSTQTENIEDRKRKGRCSKHLENRDPKTKKFIKKVTNAQMGKTKENTMSLMPLDFSGEVTPLQPGIYTARIVAAEVKTSKAGNPYINWQLETFGSPEVNGRRVFHTTPTTGGWVSKLAELHKAATGEEIDKKAKQYDPEMLVGRELVATLATRNYTAGDGTQKTSLEVKAVSPLKQ